MLRYRVPRQIGHLLSIAALVGSVATTPAGSTEAVVPSTVEPHLSSSQAFPTLRNARDPLMQRALLRELEKLQLSDAVQYGQLSVVLVDITDLTRPRLAAVNEDVMFYAASLPKIAILLGVYQRAEEGSLLLNSDTRAQLTRMIRYSSNSDATALFNRVGPEYLAELLQSDRYKLYDPDHGGGLWAGKAYASGGVWRRDPINNISHGANSHEVARFYYLLETGRLVSPEYCEEMKEILSNSAITHKFVSGLEQHRPGSKIFRKSGSWNDFHSDSAIVERNGTRYIAVALTKHPNGGEWLDRLIVSLDDIVFRRADSPTPIGLTNSSP